MSVVWEDPKEPQDLKIEKLDYEKEYNPYQYKQPSRELVLACWVLVFLAWLSVGYLWVVS